MIQDWRDAALRGEFSDAEFKQRLDKVRSICYEN